MDCREGGEGPIHPENLRIFPAETQRDRERHGKDQGFAKRKGVTADPGFQSAPQSFRKAFVIAVFLASSKCLPSVFHS